MLRINLLEGRLLLCAKKTLVNRGVKDQGAFI